MSRFRLIYLVIGWVMLGLGAAGAVLPLLPTTPFLLAAAWCFGRSSPRLTAWLLAHPVLGKPLQAWQREGAISTPTKLLAVAGMVIGYGLTMHFSELGLVPAGGLALLLLSVAIFIVTRPSPRLTGQCRTQISQS